MRYDKAVVAINDLKQIEEFLMSLPHVLDASVWVSQGRLLAHVTVSNWAPVVAKTFQAACMDSLGVHHTPEEVFLIVDRELVA